MTPYVYIISEDYGDSITPFPTLEYLLSFLKSYKPCYIPYVCAHFADGAYEKYDLEKFIELGLVKEVVVSEDEAEKYASAAWTQEKCREDDFLANLTGTVTGCLGAPPKELIKEKYIQENKYQWV